MMQQVFWRRAAKVSPPIAKRRCVCVYVRMYVLHDPVGARAVFLCVALRERRSVLSLQRLDRCLFVSCLGPERPVERPVTVRLVVVVGFGCERPFLGSVSGRAGETPTPPSINERSWFMGASVRRRVVYLRCWCPDFTRRANPANLKKYNNTRK